MFLKSTFVCYLFIIVSYLNRQVSGQCWQTAYWRGFGDPIYMDAIASCFEDVIHDLESDLDELIQDPTWKGMDNFVADASKDVFSGIEQIGGDLEDAVESIFRRRREVAAPSDECPVGEEASGLFCYRPCKKGYRGDGPVCFAESCSGFYTHNCKLPALCLLLDDIPLIGLFLSDFCKHTGLMCTKDEEECKSFNEVRVLIFNLRKNCT